MDVSERRVRQLRDEKVIAATDCHRGRVDTDGSFAEAAPSISRRHPSRSNSQSPRSLRWGAPGSSGVPGSSARRMEIPHTVSRLSRTRKRRSPVHTNCPIMLFTSSRQFIFASSRICRALDRRSRPEVDQQKRADLLGPPSKMPFSDSALRFGHWRAHTKSTPGSN